MSYSGFRAKNPKVYNVWSAINERCRNPKSIGYARYGGRGISVCAEWRDAKTFIAWALANGYAEGLEIDRIDNDGNYEPSNCRWTTRYEQLRNRSNSRWITIFGETKIQRDWELDPRCAAPTAFRSRLESGWDIEKALVTPWFGRADLNFCVNGHELTPENTQRIQTTSAGLRLRCRQCNLDAKARYRANRKAVA